MTTMDQNERSVVLADLEPGDASARMRAEVDGQQEIDGLGRAVIQFTLAPACATYRAEYAWTDGDLIIHFFLTPEMERVARAQGQQAQAVEQYWLTMFPQVLNVVAQAYFGDGPPRLQAKYTQELASWWFRACGYGDKLDPDAYALGLFERLAQALAV